MLIIRILIKYETVTIALHKVLVYVRHVAALIHTRNISLKMGTIGSICIGHLCKKYTLNSIYLSQMAIKIQKLNCLHILNSMISERKCIFENRIDIGI